MSGTVDYWRWFWIVVAFVLVVAIAFTLSRFPGTFLLGIFLYYASRPMYVRLRTRIGRPGVAAATALLLLALPVVLLFSYAAFVALNQLGSVAALDISGAQEVVAPYVQFMGEGHPKSLYRRLVTDPIELLESGRVRDAGTRVLSAIAQFGGIFLNGLFQLFIAIAVAYYLLRDDQRLTGWIQDTFDNETLNEYGYQVDADLQTVFFGNILTALLTGLIGAVVFWLLASIAPPEVALPVPILLGLVVGAASLIPVVGMKIVLLPLTGYLVFLAVTSKPGLLWFPVVFFVVTTIVVDFIPDLLLRPYVSGRNLHVGLVMFAYILGPLLVGWYGLFLGPMVLVFIIHFAGVVVPRLVAGSDTATGGTNPAPNISVSGPAQSDSADMHDEYRRVRGTDETRES